ncbi:ribonuclease HI family protein [uncultured Methanomethylovorans sp.]|uniref:ribonuclease HI family protein n=1 Tax=uncultured Methanomethylovorans sp. TaxID=183759 RepID=UPI002AA7563D|nr:ribonuclease HI family protein [uncultured Methanomethylovorans sp.]
MKIIQFDGGAVPNPGTRVIGIILLDDNHVLKEISRKLDGIGTNNEAEYSALIEGLKQALALGWTEILVHGDSKLVVNQVAGSWKVNKDNLKPLNAEAKTLLSKFKSVKIEWILREKNARADAAASRALGFDEDPFHDNLYERDIGIHCPKCKKECTFEWIVFKNGERNISQSCPVHGYLRSAPMVPAYIERIKSESLLQYMNDDKTPAKCKGCSRQRVCKLVEQGFIDICEYK